MNICVVGAGPAGLYISKYLSKHAKNITLYEKDAQYGGNYKYSPTANTKLFDKILKQKNVTLVTNFCVDTKTFNQLESKYDAFIIATGGTPKRDKSTDILCAMDVLKDRNARARLGNKLCIIGMGNVSFDLANVLYRDTKSIDICSRHNLVDSSFTTAVARDLLHTHKINVRLVSDTSIPRTETEKRKKCVFENSDESAEDRQLCLRFNTEVKNVTKKAGAYCVEYKNGEIHIYDNVISSYGFKPSCLKLKTDKPIYKVGWCVNSIGNLSDVMFAAKQLASKIVRDLLGQ